MSHCCGPKANSHREEAFQVPGMTCNHCRMAITKALTALEGVKDVSVDLERKQVTVSFDPARVDAGRMKKAIADAGYEVVG